MYCLCEDCRERSPGGLCLLPLYTANSCMLHSNTGHYSSAYCYRYNDLPPILYNNTCVLFCRPLVVRLMDNSATLEAFANQMVVTKVSYSHNHFLSHLHFILPVECNAFLARCTVYIRVTDRYKIMRINH